MPSQRDMHDAGTSARQAACKILDKIFFSNGPRAVFSVKGKIHSCPVGGRLESKYIARCDSLLIGIYDERATLNMIIDDLSSAADAGYRRH